MYHDLARCEGDRLRESGEPAREHLPQLALAFAGRLCAVSENLPQLKISFPERCRVGALTQITLTLPIDWSFKANTYKGSNFLKQIGKEGGVAKRVKEFQLQFLTGANTDS